MTNEELVMKIKAGEDVAENMLQLYDQLKAYIHSCACKYRKLIELEDLEQEGFLALYPAVDGYDSAQGVKFLSYASYWIEQRMRRYVQNNRSTLRVPEYRQERLSQLKRFRSNFEREYGRKPSEWESCCFLKISPEEYREREKTGNTDYCVSLDTPLSAFDDESVTLGDNMVSAGILEDDIIEKLRAEELSRTLLEMIDNLPGKQPLVMKKRFWENKSFRVIGEPMGITAEAVRQIEAKGLRELRKTGNIRKLEQLLPEDLR